MLISLNWLKQGLDHIDISDDELVKLIGARLVEVEGVIDQTHKYDKIYCVQVKSCEKIPDTHLTLCKIDDGAKATDVERDADGYVQVMCGAPNVHQDMFAAWIAPGAIVPSTYQDAEPFRIGMRKMLQQYDSYGMMAAADELDLGEDHAGIVELDPAHARPGMLLTELFAGLDDKILDIENKSLTHRPDTFGILGFRREVAGVLGQKFTSPSWYLQAEPDIDNDPAIRLVIETDPKLCPRYTAVVLETTGPAAAQYLTNQAALLARSGMRAIDPIVDATNFNMLLTGQPLHAFDYDKFVAVGGTDTPKIIVRAARAGEKLQLIDGKEITLNSDDIVITSNDVPVALAGAMGGANTAIDANTKRVILESATFSLYNLRKTQMAHGIFSEAITRFTKGQAAGQTLPVALRFVHDCADFLKPLAVFDSQSTQPEPPKVSVSIEHVNQLLGTNFSAEQAKELLENVEFDVALTDNILTATVPFWRTDIHIAEDLIEEIGRLSGYDNIQPVLPLHASATPNQTFALKTALRQQLSALGANEVLTYSFVHADLFRKVGQSSENSYRIVNSISPDLQYIRQTLAPSLLDKCHANLRAGYEKFALFEMNQVYSRSDGLDADGVPQNAQRLALVYLDQTSQANFYQAKHYLLELLRRRGLQVELQPFLAAKDHTNAYYEPKRSANIMLGDQLLGHLGEIKAAVLRRFKLPVGTAAFEIDLNLLLTTASSQQKQLHFSQYPFVNRDITLTVPLSADFASYERKIRQCLDAAALLYRLKATSIYHAADAPSKNLSFHLEFAHPHKTLAKDEIQAIMKQIESIK